MTLSLHAIVLDLYVLPFPFIICHSLLHFFHPLRISRLSMRLCESVALRLCLLHLACDLWSIRVGSWVRLVQSLRVRVYDLLDNLAEILLFLPDVGLLVQGGDELVAGCDGLERRD